MILNNSTPPSGRRMWIPVLVAAMGLPTFAGVATGPLAKGERPTTETILEALRHQNDGTIEVRFAMQYIPDTSSHLVRLWLFGVQATK